MFTSTRHESRDRRPKLELRRQTLRQLTSVQLRQVAGGTTTTPGRGTQADSVAPTGGSGVRTDSAAPTGGASRTA